MRKYKIYPLFLFVFLVNENVLASSNNDTLFELLKYTEKIINEKTDEIIESDFSINPKVYSGKNISFVAKNNLTTLETT